MTAHDMRLLSIRAAQNFRRLGYKENDVIGIMASNTHLLAPLAIGAFLNGTPIGTMDPLFDNDEIRHLLAITKPKVLFCDAEVYEAVKQVLVKLRYKCPIYLMKGSVEDVPSVEEIFRETGEENLFVPQKLSKGGDHIAAILCSSGTTAMQKGISMTHRGLLSQWETNLSNDEVILCFSTLYWLSGLGMMLLGTLCNGCRILTDEPFSPELMLHLIEKYKVTLALSIPPHLATMLHCPDIKFRDLSSVRTYLCGGSPVPVAVANQLQRHLKNGHLLVAYGMSEICGFITLDYPGSRKPGSVGKLLPGMEIKIVSEDGRQLGVREHGELYLGTPFNCLGYYSNPQATMDTFDSESWIHSGDIGYFDDDGYLFIVDRKKDILQYDNFEYYPSEIESLINEIPDVVEVCVFGLSNFVGKGLPAAAVLKSKGSTLNEDDVYNYVAERMSNFKHLKGGVYFVTSFPRTPSGKVLRRKVTQMLSADVYE